MNAELNISAVTWEGLDENLQKIMKDTASGIFTSLPGLLKLSAMGLVTIYPLGLTPAGRAILPAPETLTPSELDAAIYGTPEYWQQMSSASIEAHTETLERVKVLEAENARLRAALENLAAEFTPTSPAPQPPTTDEQWNTLGTDARVIAHENFQHGVNVTLWRVSQKAHKALK